MHLSARRSITIVCATALFSPLFLGTPAYAETLADKAASICGAGYYVQRSHAMSTLPNMSVTSFQLYNASSGKNCAVTLKHPSSAAFYGAKTTLGAGIRAEGGSWVKDEGAYSYYAGPVYVNASTKCVQFWGKTYQGGASSVWYETYTSPLGNCG